MSLMVNYTSLLDNKVKKVFPVVNPTVEEEYTKYSTKIVEKQRDYTIQGVTSLGMGEILADGQIPSTDTIIQGFSKTFTQGIFHKRVTFSFATYYYLFEAGEGAKIDGKVKSEILDLKNSITHLKNYLAQSMLQNGFSSSFQFTPIGGFAGTTTINTTGIDAVAAFSASHPQEDGGPAWSNLIFSATVNPIFSLTSLIAARRQLADRKDARGLPMTGIKGDTLIVSDRSTAYTIATSISNTLKNGKYPSASLGVSGSFVDANPTESFDIIPLTRYGGTAVADATYFIVDKSMIKENFGLLYIQSMPVTLSPMYQDLSGNQDYILNVSEFAQFGFGDMRGWMASNGAGV